MLRDDRTRSVGVQGLMRQKLDEGDTDTAMALAKKAFALQARQRAGAADAVRPAVEEGGLGRRARDAERLDARAAAAARRRHPPRRGAVARRRPRGARRRQHRARQRGGAAGEPAGADADPGGGAGGAGRTPANGAKRKATKTLTAAWAANPHPELAAAFAAIEPDETPAARRKRFATLIAAAPGHPESRLLEAELALAAEDFPAARKALGDLAETEPTTRSLALMAAIERGQGAPDAVVRGWLAKALGASRGPQWICGNCSHVHAAWAPVCENCGAFDTLDWKTPAHAADDAGLAEFGDAAADRRRAEPEPTEAGAGRAAPGPSRRRAEPRPAPTSTTPSWPTSPTRPGPPAAVNPLL